MAVNPKTSQRPSLESSFIQYGKNNLCLNNLGYMTRVTEKFRNEENQALCSFIKEALFSFPPVFCKSLVTNWFCLNNALLCPFLATTGYLQAAHHLTWALSHNWFFTLDRIFNCKISEKSSPGWRLKNFSLSNTTTQWWSPGECKVKLIFASLSSAWLEALPVYPQ